MEIPFISKRQFNRLKKHLPVQSNAEKIDARTVLSCAIWMIKGGRHWSDIPEKYGKFDTIRKRFARWSKSGIFRKVFYFLVSKARKGAPAMLDSTVAKAHRTSASLRSDKAPREIGRSVGGLTTKIHLIANSEKIPLDFSLTGGQVNDAKEGIKIIRKNFFRFKILLADRAYDTDKIREDLRKAGKQARIPPKSNRKNSAEYDKKLYKERSVIEIMFGRLKDWLGIAMRQCRCSHIFNSAVCLALITIFLYVH